MSLPSGHGRQGFRHTDIPGVDSGCVNDWVPEAVGRLDLDSLVGLSVAEARARVEEAGGILRAVPRGRAIGLSYQPGRVTVLTDDDRVTSVLGLEGRVADDYVPAAVGRLDLDSLVGIRSAQAQGASTRRRR